MPPIWESHAPTRIHWSSRARKPQTFMVNFRVDNLDQLLADLAAAGVRVDPKREEYSFGRFAWIWDPEGNRVELWEPLPAV